jgi:hypothetical protein
LGQSIFDSIGPKIRLPQCSDLVAIGVKADVSITAVPMGAMEMILDAVHVSTDPVYLKTQTWG